ncbi:MAG TPA: xanthine dehydrogenase family protein molybdopterin-binding subunit [Acidobacteriota bacterium]|nr:xanthine dehydrogenase family protein molybdopterin-binding subunit [Acidobacteriota bacterium]HQM64739.1 xanthine dehydrogenase family protein molybdopterin-binding subunit [Acidobacteriota bacterium]
MSEVNPPRAWRNDAVAKVTGRARYADDLKFHGLLHAVPVYTDHVHARLRGVDTAAAAAAPGVVRVITAADVPGSVTFGQILQDYHMLAGDTIRCHGDVVAVVVAETRAAAVAAARLVTVAADPLPAVLDPEEALRPGAPLVHERHGTNVINHHRVRRGDVAAGFAASDVVVEQVFRTSFIEHAYLEPEAAVAVPRPDGVMEIYGSMQHPFSTRRFTAALLGVPLADVEVRSVPMGGGFGGKDDTAAIVCARAALAARLTGRPVKLTYDREWSVRESYKRHPYRLHYRMGLTRDGRIQAVAVRIVADGGAYCSVTPWVTWRSTVQCCGPYRVPHVACDTYGVYTNNVFTGAMRGFGSPQVNFCIEQLVEMAAERLDLSPLEIRRRNMVRQGDTTITGQVLDTHVVSLAQVLDRVVAESDYEARRGRCAHGRADGDELYGIGLAMSYRGMSLGAEGKDFNSAIVNVQFDGSILLETGIHENGQGAESAMVLLLADELGVRRERIRYRQASTSVIPDGGTTVASRGTLMGGGAVVHAARALKEKMAAVLAPRLGCAPGDVAFRDDAVWGPGGARLTIEEAVREMWQAQEYPYAFGVFQGPQVTWDEATGQGNAYFTWVYGCQAAEVTVNRRTGKVKVLGMWAAHDVGRAVNPPMLLGQFYGGMAMGLGYGLTEAVTIDAGRIRSLNFDRYRIARATDLPEMHATIVENPDPLSPSRAKGIGEPTNELMAPAIANAVAAATGRRYCEQPVRVDAAELAGGPAGAEGTEPDANGEAPCN